MLVEGRIAAVLWISLFLLALALFNTGNWFGRIAIATTGIVIFVIIHHASSLIQTFFAYTWIWLFLFGGFGHVLAMQRLRRDFPDESSDPYQLRRMAFLPASLWSGLFWLASLAALIYGAGLLLGIIRVGT